MASPRCFHDLDLLHDRRAPTEFDKNHGPSERQTDFAALDDRSPFFTPTDPYTPAIDVGEIVNMQIDPAKFDSSTLTIQIDTPDDQHAKAEFDLQTLR